MGRAGSLVSHDALGRGHDGNTQAVEDPGQLVSTGIDTQAGLETRRRPVMTFSLPGLYFRVTRMTP